MKTIKVQFKVYGQLDDCLGKEERGMVLESNIKGSPSIKDSIEALGIPHVEIDSIFVNDRPVVFGHQMQSGDSIRIYPAKYTIANSHVKHLLRQPDEIHFVLDCHLGKLAGRLRLLGFDSAYESGFNDNEIVQITAREGRMVFTRDIGLLKHKILKYGYWIISTNAESQLREVVKYYDLGREVKAFTRCLKYNGLIRHFKDLKHIEYIDVTAINLKTKLFRCQQCGQIY